MAVKTKTCTLFFLRRTYANAHIGMLLIFFAPCVWCLCVFKMPLWTSQKYRRRPNLALILSLFPSEAALQHSHTHTHTNDPETHFDLHHLVWSAGPRAWQLMINISLCPLPSRVQVHANAHAQKEIILLVFMHILYTHSLWWHMPPPCPRSMLRRPSGWLAGWPALWNSACDTVLSQQGHLCTLIYESFSFAISLLLSENVTCRVLGWPHQKSYQGGFPGCRNKSLCSF